jgi:hypothetical protein
MNNITTDSINIKGKKGEYDENLHPIRSDNLDKIDKLLENHTLLKLTREETDNQNIP